MKDALERVRRLLEENGIEPSDKDEANITAVCDLFRLQQRGHPVEGGPNLPLAQAIREITRGFDVRITSRISHVEDDDNLLYEIKATEMLDREALLEEQRAPRVLGLAVRHPEPQVPDELAESILNMHFADAMNAILRAIQNPTITPTQVEADTFIPDYEEE